MATFRDVPSTAAFSADIEWVADQGILRGWADGTYRPLATIRRDAMAAAFHRLAGEPDIAPPARSPFRDVSTRQQFYAQMCWVRARGLLTGWADGSFRPMQEIARDASCALFYRAAGSPSYSPPRRSPFRDVKPSRQFYKEICWARHAGITTGWADGTFRPAQATARNAMAAFIRRFDLATG